jgi:RNA polymerase sigma factor (TIGR02999 family)
MSGARSDVTQGLRELREGVPGAFNRLVDLVYDDLRLIAGRQLGRNRDWTISPTALVHEAFLKLASGAELEARDRAQFFAACSVVMRNLVVDFSRKRSAVKRAGNRDRVTLDETHLVVDAQADQLLALDEALRELRRVDPRLERVVECRFFGGMTEPETATALGISERTVRRDWLKSRGLLVAMLAEDSP